MRDIHPMQHSMRFRLAVTYAGIALLSLAIVGTVMVVVLDRYFAQAEDSYLQAVASRAGNELTRRATTAEQLDLGTKILALTSNVRVRVFDTTGVLAADSGLPQDIDQSVFVPPSADEGDDGPDGGPDRRHLPSPLGSGPFGSSSTTSTARSDRVLKAPLTDANGNVIGSVLLSDGPRYGRDVLMSVAEVLLVAALLAMVSSAGAGYVVAARITRPIEALTETSDRMAEGDLSARSDVDREDEVGQLADSFNAMADRVESTVVTLRRFVADAAHEIGTPLTALQADLELADASTSDEEERVFVKRALGQARRIESLSGNLLRLSRLETGELPDADERVDMVRLVRETADSAASRAEQAGIELDIEVPDAALVIMGDRAKLQVVLDNLVDNAFKFTPVDGRVSIGVRAEDSRAIAWVTDTGIGIPQAEQSEIFSRFYRARNVASYPGSGLGLAIVQATVEGYGGSVHFDSSEAGTTFEVRLPLA